MNLRKKGKGEDSVWQIAGSILIQNEENKLQERSLTLLHHPRAAMEWVREAEDATCLEDLETFALVTAKVMLDFEVLDSKIARQQHKSKEDA